MTPSTACVDLVCSFEGFEPQKYNDAAGHCTIGYGTLLHKGNCHGNEGYDHGITEVEAKLMLYQHLAEAGKDVDRLVKVPLAQCQFDALCSWTYNLGEGNLATSTLLEKLNEGEYSAVPEEMLRWNKAGGIVLNGLVKRRAAEAAMWRNL